MRKNDDILWKSVIEEVFDDLLRFIFPEADKIFDIDRGFEFLDKELAKMCPEPYRKSETRFVDKLVKVYRRDGREEWVLCHIEVQGGTRKKALFAERMFRYYCRIFDRHQKPITAIAIFTAKDGKTMPDRYVYRFLGTSHVYQYNTYCITDPTDEALEKSNNPFAVVVLAARKALLAGKIPEEELLNQKTLIARLLLRKKRFSRKKIRGIMTFLNNYILFKEPETNRIFIKELDKITGKKNTMGIIEALAEIREQEGREKGLVEGLAIGDEKRSLLVVENLLRDTDFPIEKIADLAGVSAAYVKRVKKGIRSK